MHWMKDPKNRNKVLALVKKSHASRRRNQKMSRAEMVVRKAVVKGKSKRTTIPVDSESRSTYRLVADQAVERDEVHLLAEALGMAALRKVMVGR